MRSSATTPSARPNRARPTPNSSSRRKTSREQLDWLESHGYEAVGLEAVQAAWFGGGTLPRNRSCSPSTGSTANCSPTVVPELSRRGWPGVLVLDAEAPPPQTAAVARLIALGWDIEPSGRDPGAARRFVKAHYPAAARDLRLPARRVPRSADRGGQGSGLRRRDRDSTGGGFAEASHALPLPRITIFGLSKISGFDEAIRSGGQGVGA